MPMNFETGPTDPTMLPLTYARTSPSIGIYITAPDGSRKRIGAIKSMSRTVSRSATRRFELDAAIPGRTVEIVPGKVETLELTVRRAMLFSSDIMEAFGFLSATDLVTQNIPIDVVEIRYARPTLSNGVVVKNEATQIITYKGCYFTSNPMSVDVDGDWQIIQEATLMVSTVETSGGPTNTTANI